MVRMQDPKRRVEHKSNLKFKVWLFPLEHFIYLKTLPKQFSQIYIIFITHSLLRVLLQNIQKQERLQRRRFLSALC